MNHVSRQRLLAYLSGAFLLTHLLYWLAGVRFEADILNFGYQNLDPELLRHDLLRSLWVLHSQPPLFNLFEGVVLKAFPNHSAAVFQALYVLCGFGLYVGVFALMRGLGVSRSVAFGLSTGLLISPSFVLYEHFLTYDFPLATLLVASALSLLAFVKQGKRSAAFGFFGCLLVLCGTRSMFHLVYLTVVVCALLAMKTVPRRVTLQAALLPFLLVVGLYGKNAALFGKFTGSTWMGMSAWNVATSRSLYGLPPAIDALSQAGQVSPLARIPAYSDLEQYPAAYVQTPLLQRDGYAAIAALSQWRKSNGKVNYNHVAYIGLSDVYMRDALTVLRRRPSVYLKGIVLAFRFYFNSSSDYLFLQDNRARIGHWNAFFDRVVYGKWSHLHLCFALMLALPALWLFGLSLAFAKRGSEQMLSLPQRATIAFLCFNIAYVAVVGNLMEVGENNRFRFLTDPFSVVLLALLCQFMLNRLHRSKQLAARFEDSQTIHEDNTAEPNRTPALV